MVCLMVLCITVGGICAVYVTSNVTVCFSVIGSKGSLFFVSHSTPIHMNPESEPYAVVCLHHYVSLEMVCIYVIDTSAKSISARILL